MNEKEQQIHSQTRALLSKYTDEYLNDDAILEVENNFKEFFKFFWNGMKMIFTKKQVT